MKENVTLLQNGRTFYRSLSIPKVGFKTDLAKFAIAQSTFFHVQFRNLDKLETLSSNLVLKTSQFWHSVQSICSWKMLFIPCHFKNYGVLCYTLHSKIAFECPSVPPSISASFSLCWEHFLTDFLQTCYESWYWEGVSWDCRWVNFGK